MRSRWQKRTDKARRRWRRACRDYERRSRYWGRRLGVEPRFAFAELFYENLAKRLRAEILGPEVA